jgi:hypothetical protein
LLNDKSQTLNINGGTVSTSREAVSEVTAVLGGPGSLDQEDTEDADEDNEGTKGAGSDKARKSRHRKVRRSLEKLTRISSERKRRTRQLKALSTISPPKSPMAGDQTIKLEAPKRQSLWASIFGNGKPEYTSMRVYNSSSYAVFIVDLYSP